MYVRGQCPSDSATPIKAKTLNKPVLVCWTTDGYLPALVCQGKQWERQPGFVHYSASHCLKWKKSLASVRSVFYKCSLTCCAKRIADQNHEHVYGGNICFFHIVRFVSAASRCINETSNERNPTLYSYIQILTDITLCFSHDLTLRGCGQVRPCLWGWRVNTWRGGSVCGSPSVLHL